MASSIRNTNCLPIKSNKSYRLNESKPVGPRAKIKLGPYLDESTFTVYYYTDYSRLISYNIYPYKYMYINIKEMLYIQYKHIRTSNSWS